LGERPPGSGELKSSLGSASPRFVEVLRADLAALARGDPVAALLFSALDAEASPPLLIRYLVRLIREKDFAPAALLVARMRAIEIDTAFVRKLIGELAAHGAIAHALAGLEAARDLHAARDSIAFLRALGDEGLPVLFGRIDSIEGAGARELLAALAIDLSLRRRPDLLNLMRTARPEVAIELLRASVACVPEEQADLITIGLVHSDAAVRVQALRSLVRFAPGRPDDLFSRALQDREQSVRLSAIRAIGARKSEAGAREIAELLLRHDILDRDPAELRPMLVTFAMLRGKAAIPELTRLLRKASALTSAHRSATIDALAFALSVVDNEESRAILAKGARSLNPRLRNACKLALDEGGRTELLRMNAPMDPPPAGREGSPAWPASHPSPPPAPATSRLLRAAKTPTPVKIPPPRTPLATPRPSAIEPIPLTRTAKPSAPVRPKEQARPSRAPVAPAKPLNEHAPKHAGGTYSFIWRPLRPQASAEHDVVIEAPIDLSIQGTGDLETLDVGEAPTFTIFDDSLSPVPD
jgi:hypothetical protein